MVHAADQNLIDSAEALASVVERASCTHTILPEALAGARVTFAAVPTTLRTIDAIENDWRRLCPD